MIAVRSLLLAGVMLAAVAVFPVRGADKPIKALLVTGGCCHDYDRQQLILTQGISARVDVDWTVVQQGGKTTDTKIPLYENKSWADGYDVVVHNECFARVTDPSWVDRILKPHREGTAAVLIHCAMHCYRIGDDRWFEFCGIQSPRHGAKYPFEVKNIQPEHFIMQDFGESWTTPKGELYFSVKVFDTATPLGHALRNSDQQPQVCVWTNQYQKARVFATTIGHHNETMAEPEYLNLVSRGLVWAVNKDTGTPIRKTDEATDLKILKLINIPLENGEPVTSQVDCCGGIPVASQE